jgi:hypothetical protein
MLSGYPMWEREARHYPGHVRIITILIIGAVLWLAVVALTALSPATQGAELAPPDADSPACAELARLDRHGVHSGTWHARVSTACHGPGGR